MIYEKEQLSSMLPIPLSTSVSEDASAWLLESFLLTIQSVYEQRRDQMDRQVTHVNSFYRNDIKRAVEVTRGVLNLIGVWPSCNTSSTLKIVKTKLLRFLCQLLLCIVFVSGWLKILLTELNMYRRIKVIGTICNVLMTILKHIALIYQGERLKDCIRYIEEDWRKVSPTEDRKIMVDYARIGRSLAILCVVFMYTSGFSYRTILPLSRGVIVTLQNVTIRPLPFDGYLFIDPQKTPAYEIIFTIQLFSGLIQYSVTSGACSLAALLVLHACGQLKILIVKMENLTQTKQLPNKNTNRKLIVIVRQHIRIKSFLREVEETLQYTCLVEVIGSTFILCICFYVLMERGENSMTSIVVHTIVLLTFMFNIFILCFIGQLLTDQSR
ncbi:uncharacterized protein [Anoplolepis gracilipes]|uniref:uncharacterized protein isoform X2 n=1 Tax=Anoplolepis gracilipes TaxID=354296 RepID=UPI003B9F8BC9